MDDPQSGMSLLHWASKCGHATVVKTLILSVMADQRAAFIDLQDAGGWTALHYACSADSKCSAIVLMYYGANADIRNDKGLSALLISLQLRHLFFTNLLLPFVKDVAGIDEKGKSPLHHACEQGLMSVARSLMDRGASVNLHDEQLRSPL